MGELYDADYKKGTKVFLETSKEVATAYKKYRKVLYDNSPFDKKTTELILLSASVAVKCEYCIDTHSKQAKLAGANEKEIASVISFAASLNYGATVSYGIRALK